ncbi:MAG: amidohydrolase family protein [Truepera sp.]|nr:amidohydrolase family protein [Truepera sp.]
MSDEGRVLAFRVDGLIDGNGGPPLRDAALVVTGGRIASVGSRTDVVVPEGAEIIEAPGYTLMPGLVDVHVHLAYSGIPHKRAFRAEGTDMSYPAMALRAAGYARDTLRAGFTAVRDLNAPGGVVIDLRDAIDAGHVPGPRIRACGLGLSASGGHMDQPGFGDHVSLNGMNAVCDGPNAFRKGVREQVKRGADLIKINVCVSSIKDPERPYRQEMTDEEIEAACDEAHRLERPVAAHTSGGPAIATAVRAGLNTVEHGHWIDEETAALMAERGTFYVPTLLVNERNFDFTQEEMGASDASWRWLNLSREAKWESLVNAHRAGVKIAVGTDAGFMLPHGVMNAVEIELLVRGGLTPLEAITAATRTGAELLGLDEAGTLQAGKLADLVLVCGDPSADITLLQDPSRLRVFKDGKEVS